LEGFETHCTQLFGFTQYGDTHEFSSNKIFNKSDDEWQSFLVEHEEWLDENVTFPILSQRELEKRRRQRDAQSQPDSISAFMIKVKLY